MVLDLPHAKKVVSPGKYRLCLMSSTRKQKGQTDAV